MDWKAPCYIWLILFQKKYPNVQWVFQWLHLGIGSTSIQGTVGLLIQVFQWHEHIEVKGYSLQNQKFNPGS